jgi:hypothetical protein
MLLVAAFSASGLAARAQVFYTVQESTDVLYTVDVASLTFTPVGPLGVAYAFGDLAYDTSTGTMYMSNGWGQGSGVPSNLYKVNLATGAATFIGSMGEASVFALAYDPVGNKLYGATSTISPYDFVEINRSTGAATVIGGTNLSTDGLTFVGSTGDVVGLNAGPGGLYSFDLSTGVPTQLTPGGGFVDNCGIAWSSATNKIYSIDWSGNLFAFDVANGYARQTVTNGFGSYDGLASVSSVAPPPTAYCTAGTTTNGCLASISSSGAPSASAGSGFSITVTSLEGQKQGILFYGINNTGFTPTPWSTGPSFLCVKHPTQRTGVMNSGGTIATCSGSIALDWNQYIATHPTALGNPFSAGQKVYAQCWFRDPPAPKTTNLSNALSFTVGP